MIAVYAKWNFANIHGCGWGWAGVIWIFSVVSYVPLDILKFAIRYILSGKAWLTMLDNRVRVELYASPIVSANYFHSCPYY